MPTRLYRPSRVALVVSVLSGARLPRTAVRAAEEAVVQDQVQPRMKLSKRHSEEEEAEEVVAGGLQVHWEGHCESSPRLTFLFLVADYVRVSLQSCCSSSGTSMAPARHHLWSRRPVLLFCNRPPRVCRCAVEEGRAEEEAREDRGCWPA